MFCRKCGAEIRPKAKFCAKCGAPVPAPAGSSVPPVTPPETGPLRPPIMYTDPVRPPVELLKPTETTPEEAKPKLIINMPKTTASSSNGQFDEWFSEPDDLN